MRFKNLTIFLFLVALSQTSLGQAKNDISFSDIQTGKIDNLTTFKRLTKYEIRMDSLMEKHNKTSLKMMLDGKAFIKGTSKGLVDSAIQEQKILNTIRYKDNRSRYQFYHYKNGQLLDKTKNESDLDSVGTECSCILENDTLKVRMSIWVFGGFAFPINLVGNKFTSKYWLDEHKRKIFKLNENDSLSDDILIPMTEQKLILDTFPAYKLGQQLTGYFTFKSANYFRASDFEDWSAKDEYSDKNMDTMQTKGVVLFTCKVRQKLQRDE
jgi:hypothetical protein